MSKFPKFFKFNVFTFFDKQSFTLCQSIKKGAVVPYNPSNNKKHSAIDEEKLIEVTFGPSKKQYKRMIKNLKRYSQEDARLALDQLPNCFENEQSAASLVLLVLLSKIATPLVGTLSIPLLPLDNASPAAFRYAAKLLDMIQGPDIWSGEGYRLKRPTLVVPRKPLITASYSCAVEDYIKGYYTDDRGKELTFWLPYVNQAAVLSPELPASVVQSIISSSPFALLIGNSRLKASDGRPSLKIDATNLDSVDQEKLESLSCGDLYFLLISFLRWFNKHPKQHVRELTEYSQRFHLVERRGKFTKAITSSQTDTFCYGLALLAMLLNFCSEDLRYISSEKAEEILLHYWRLVLPESAPKEEPPADDFLPAYDDPDVFYNSLASYLTTYPNQMMHQRKAASGTMAIVYSIGKVPYLILPRTAFFKFYQSWLKEKGTSLDLTNETAIQRALTVAGIQFKSESSTNKSKTDSGKKDTYSWRFAFYTNCEENPYCLALPTESLPESIQNLLNKPEAGGEH